MLNKAHFYYFNVGTGKSFIGALLAKIIHDFSSERILVVCYTNHALDQFLEDLLDIGFSNDSIVRLGGKSTTRTASLALSHLQKMRVGPRLSRSDWTQIDALKAQASKLKDELQAEFGRYHSMNISLKFILDHLEVSMDDEDMRFYDALSLPDLSEDGQGGMIHVGRDGKVIRTTYLLESWMNNRSPAAFQNHPRIRSAREIWNMAPQARQVCVTRWKNNIVRDHAERLHGLVSKYNTCLSEMNAIFMRKDGELVGSRRIIGCTTTAAAKYNEIIRTAQPDILLVEEAGEILEPHILTSLNPKSKQIILIGDHK